MRDELELWEGECAKRVARGKVTDYGHHNVAKGDAVLVCGTWLKVAPCNVKTVAVETRHIWTNKTPWHEVQDHRTVA